MKMDTVSHQQNPPAPPVDCTALGKERLLRVILPYPTENVSPLRHRNFARGEKLSGGKNFRVAKRDLGPKGAFGLGFTYFWPKRQVHASAAPKLTRPQSPGGGKLFLGENFWRDTVVEEGPWGRPRLIEHGFQGFAAGGGFD